MSSLALCVFCGLIVFFGKVRGEFLINDFRLSPLYGDLMPTDSPLASAIVNDVIQCAKLCRHSKACVGFFYDDVRLCLVYDVRFSVLTYNTQNGIRAYAIVSEVTSDCYDVWMNGMPSGVYYITPTDLGPLVKVYCEIGPHYDDIWLVFQRRMDGSEKFFKSWKGYREGFGELYREFWLGNAIIHRLTSLGKYELRVDLEAFNGSTAYAHYSSFRLASEDEYFQLFVGTCTGTAGNSLQYHNGHNFTTFDRKYNPINPRCASSSRGGWWYVDCHAANLNGLYQTDNPIQKYDGISWSDWLGVHYSLKRTVMKMKFIPKIILP